ncbi:extracellular solute-binding protein [Candidatus Phytoplasma solani]|uniref:ABC-type spermidine/putrescine transport system, substrate-binding protein n=2 Tax=Candidatus Phytoplasma solani TaxID=69896 RepID=A0A421NXA1_9MOLU|nr:extracellular solute-binding protein [Candidatus Phytoplasma solani]RMI88659.1 ABC-type spermidine/putrescine transport system, substrate-binding protein [Candidatus Phytoplasma solani]CCP88378.1 ABC-type spermidine/putrescine-binding periplasmic protein [Candidatus Phytoplasma solani]
MKLNIKKILSYFGFGIVFVLVVILLIKFNKSESEDNKSQQVLTLFNWGEYLDPQTIIDFEKETKIKVKQVLFSSNELAVTKIKSHNKYDLAILSEYAIDQLIQADFLEKIDKDKLKEKEEKEKEYYSDSQYNDKYKEINKKLPNNFADYAVPYFWGKVVLVYNKKKIKKEEIEDKGFKILKDAKLKVALCNNSRDSLMIGLKANGLSIDNLTPEDLKKAKNWILDLKKEKSDVAFINDQLIDRMLQKNQEYYDVAVAYSGDAKFLKEKNDNLDFISPKEGTNIWVDALVMPKESKKDLAYQFITFLREKNNYNKNLKYVKYDSPYKNNENNEIEIKEKEDQVYKYDENNQKLINTYWNDIIAYPSKKDYWLFVLSTLIVISIFVWYVINKLSNNYIRI